MSLSKLNKLVPFDQDSGNTVQNSPPVNDVSDVVNPVIPSGTPSDVPKELSIFMRTEEQFLPTGKTWSDLSPEEKQSVLNRYRFDPYKPGIYQGITGYGGSF